MIANAASLTDVLSIVESELAKKEPKSGSRRATVINSIVYFARMVDSYAKALDVYVNKSPEVASVVWGSCRVVLQVSLFVP